MVRNCKVPRQVRRLSGIVPVMNGRLSRGDIARMAQVGRQTLCDWVRHFNAEGAGGLKDRRRSRRPPALKATERAEVGGWLADGPKAGMPRWTLKALAGRIGASSPRFRYFRTVLQSRPVLRAFSLIKSPCHFKS